MSRRLDAPPHGWSSEDESPFHRPQPQRRWSARSSSSAGAPSSGSGRRHDLSSTWHSFERDIRGGISHLEHPKQKKHHHHHHQVPDQTRAADQPSDGSPPPSPSSPSPSPSSAPSNDPLLRTKAFKKLDKSRPGYHLERVTPDQLQQFDKAAADDARAKGINVVLAWVKDTPGSSSSSASAPVQLVSQKDLKKLQKGSSGGGSPSASDAGGAQAAMGTHTDSEDADSESEGNQSPGPTSQRTKAATNGGATPPPSDDEHGSGDDSSAPKTGASTKAGAGAAPPSPAPSDDDGHHSDADGKNVHTDSDAGPATPTTPTKGSSDASKALAVGGAAALGAAAAASAGAATADGGDGGNLSDEDVKNAASGDAPPPSPTTQPQADANPSPPASPTTDSAPTTSSADGQTGDTTAALGDAPPSSNSGAASDKALLNNTATVDKDDPSASASAGGDSSGGGNLSDSEVDAAAKGGPDSTSAAPPPSPGPGGAPDPSSTSTKDVSTLDSSTDASGGATPPDGGASADASAMGKDDSGGAPADTGDSAKPGSLSDDEVDKAQDKSATPDTGASASGGAGSLGGDSSLDTSSGAGGASLDSSTKDGSPTTDTSGLSGGGGDLPKDTPDTAGGGGGATGTGGDTGSGATGDTGLGTGDTGTGAGGLDGGAGGGPPPPDTGAAGTGDTGDPSSAKDSLGDKGAGLDGDTPPPAGDAGLGGDSAANPPPSPAGAAGGGLGGAGGDLGGGGGANPPPSPMDSGGGGLGGAGGMGSDGGLGGGAGGGMNDPSMGGGGMNDPSMMGGGGMNDPSMMGGGGGGMNDPSMMGGGMGNDFGNQDPYSQGNLGGNDYNPMRDKYGQDKDNDDNGDWREERRRRQQEDDDRARAEREREQEKDKSLSDEEEEKEKKKKKKGDSEEEGEAAELRDGAHEEDEEHVELSPGARRKLERKLNDLHKRRAREILSLHPLAATYTHDESPASLEPLTSAFHKLMHTSYHIQSIQHSLDQKPTPIPTAEDLHLPEKLYGELLHGFHEENERQLQEAEAALEAKPNDKKLQRKVEELREEQERREEQEEVFTAGDAPAHHHPHPSREGQEEPTVLRDAPRMKDNDSEPDTEKSRAQRMHEHHAALREARHRREHIEDQIRRHGSTPEREKELHEAKERESAARKKFDELREEHSERHHQSALHAQEAARKREEAEEKLKNASPAEKERLEKEVEEARKNEHNALAEHAARRRTLHESLTRKEHEARARVQRLQALQRSGAQVDPAELQEAVNEYQRARRERDEFAAHGAHDDPSHTSRLLEVEGEHLESRQAHLKKKIKKIKEEIEDPKNAKHRGKLEEELKQLEKESTGESLKALARRKEEHTKEQAKMSSEERNPLDADDRERGAVGHHLRFHPQARAETHQGESHHRGDGEHPTEHRREPGTPEEKLKYLMGDLAKEVEVVKVEARKVHELPLAAQEHKLHEPFNKLFHIYYHIRSLQDKLNLPDAQKTKPPGPNKLEMNQSVYAKLAAGLHTHNTRELERARDEVKEHPEDKEAQRRLRHAEHAHHQSQEHLNLILPIHLPLLENLRKQVRDERGKPGEAHAVEEWAHAAETNVQLAQHEVHRAHHQLEEFKELEKKGELKPDQKEHLEQAGEMYENAKEELKKAKAEADDAQEQTHRLNPHKRFHPQPRTAEGPQPEAHHHSASQREETHVPEPKLLAAFESEKREVRTVSGQVGELPAKEQEHRLRGPFDKLFATFYHLSSLQRKLYPPADKAKFTPLPGPNPLGMNRDVYVKLVASLHTHNARLLEQAKAAAAEHPDDEEAKRRLRHAQSAHARSGEHLDLLPPIDLPPLEHLRERVEAERGREGEEHAAREYVHAAETNVNLAQHAAHHAHRQLEEVEKAHKEGKVAAEKVAEAKEAQRKAEEALETARKEAEEAREIERKAKLDSHKAEQKERGGHFLRFHPQPRASDGPHGEAEARHEAHDASEGEREAHHHPAGAHHPSEQLKAPHTPQEKLAHLTRNLEEEQVEVRKRAKEVFSLSLASQESSLREPFHKLFKTYYHLKSLELKLIREKVPGIKVTPMPVPKDLGVHPSVYNALVHNLHLENATELDQAQAAAKEHPDDEDAQRRLRHAKSAHDRSGEHLKMAVPAHLKVLTHLHNAAVAATGQPGELQATEQWVHAAQTNLHLSHHNLQLMHSQLEIFTRNHKEGKASAEDLEKAQSAYHAAEQRLEEAKKEAHEAKEAEHAARKTARPLRENKRSEKMRAHHGQLIQARRHREELEDAERRREGEESSPDQRRELTAAREREAHARDTQRGDHAHHAHVLDEAAERAHSATEHREEMQRRRDQAPEHERRHHLAALEDAKSDEHDALEEHASRRRTMHEALTREEEHARDRRDRLHSLRARGVHVDEGEMRRADSEHAEAVRRRDEFGRHGHFGPAHDGRMIGIRGQHIEANRVQLQGQIERLEEEIEHTKNGHHKTKLERELQHLRAEEERAGGDLTANEARGEEHRLKHAKMGGDERRPSDMDEREREAVSHTRSHPNSPRPTQKKQRHRPELPDLEEMSTEQKEKKHAAVAAERAKRKAERRNRKKSDGETAKRKAEMRAKHGRDAAPARELQHQKAEEMTRKRKEREEEEEKKSEEQKAHERDVVRERRAKEREVNLKREEERKEQAKRKREVMLRERQQRMQTQTAMRIHNEEVRKQRQAEYLRREREAAMRRRAKQPRPMRRSSSRIRGMRRSGSMRR